MATDSAHSDRIVTHGVGFFVKHLYNQLIGQRILRKVSIIVVNAFLRVRQQRLTRAFSTNIALQISNNIPLPFAIPDRFPCRAANHQVPIAGENL